ncbi:polysaccharide pyruvyl transferase [Flammeovirgaceae bacterium 311]|nr:polysaccharide pyruvyl transferase [Flammeovirgaceae bacterium 311]
MKILITNIVTLNGGDYAILKSMMSILKRAYGDNIEFIVYDFHSSVATKYYPDIHFEHTLYNKYKNRTTIGFRQLFHKITKKASPLERLMLAAKLSSKGLGSLVSLLLSRDEQKDFDHYKSADLIISSGGTYLVENYSLTARLYDYYFTLALSKPLVFFTQSLGPFTNPYNIAALKDILNRACLILLRDKGSFENLVNINVDITKARICSDVVFADADLLLLSEAKNRKIQEPVKVGISVRDWQYFKNRTQNKGTEKYYNSVAAICNYITNELGGEVVFISTCQAIDEYHVDDSKTAQRIYNLLNDATKAKTTVNNMFHTPEDFKSIIGKFDIMISTRLHGAIQSLDVGVPVLPIAYEFKTKELFIKLIDEKFILDIDTIDEQEAVNVFVDFYKALPSLRKHLFEQVEKEHFSAMKAKEYLLKIL